MADELAAVILGVRFGKRDPTADSQNAPADLDPVARMERREGADRKFARGESETAVSNREHG
jgi:hypothetical protein